MRRFIATAAAIIAAIVLGGFASIYSGLYYIGADQPHWPVTSWLLDEARTRSIKFHASGIAVPPGLDDPAKLIVGITHFADHCAVCHGAPGVSQGDIAQGLYPRPPNLAAAASRYTPGEVFWILKHGIKMSGMPAWGDHGDDELWATVAFLQKLPGMTEADYAALVAASRPPDPPQPASGPSVGNQPEQHQPQGSQPGADQPQAHQPQSPQAAPATKPVPAPRESKHGHPGHRH
jgi:hypothetical protein